MSFETYTPHRLVGLEPGEVSFNKGGGLRVHVDDLRRAGLRDHIEIRIDVANMRIQLRKPHVPDAKINIGKGTNARTINVQGVLKRMRVDPKVFKRRRPCEVDASTHTITIGLGPDLPLLKAKAKG